MKALRVVCRPPKRLECVTGPNPAGVRSTPSPGPIADFGEDPAQINDFCGDDQKARTTKAAEDVTPLSVRELGIDPVEQMDVGR